MGREYFVSYNKSNISKFDDEIVVQHFKTIYKDIYNSYPGINKWVRKVLDHFYMENDREILYAYSKKNELMYMIILKKSEKKICHFYVYRKFRDRKLPMELLKACFRILKTEKPLITISSLNIDRYRTLLDKMGFEQTDLIKDAYAENVDEYIFNNSSDLLN